MTGTKSNFGKRALLGIDKNLKKINEKLRNKGQPTFNIFIRDSKGVPSVGEYEVKSLIENHHVSVIIGGLFSGESKQEYLRAKRYGVFFISLSQIYLGRGEKDHLLLEVPGSIESQINKLFAKSTISNFGKKAAIIFPENEFGNIYLEEFWKKAEEEDIEVVSLSSYNRDKKNYSESIRKLLGLSFTRERSEELRVLKEIHSLERSKSIRRVQNLRPEIDFDWIFVASSPRETLQIVPTFHYFDASNLSIIGIPSWRSRIISRESDRLGALYFIGDDIEKIDKKFFKEFKDTYNRFAKIIEIISYEASVVALKLLSNGKFYDKRENFEEHLQSFKEIKGFSNKWNFVDGLWIKSLVGNKIFRKKIQYSF